MPITVIRFIDLLFLFIGFLLETAHRIVGYSSLYKKLLFLVCSIMELF